MAERGLLRDAIVYLGSAVVCVPITNRLKLGSVLGYLLAGCVIGPFGLRLVHDVESTLHFAELGVVLMLFLIGLELDPKRLWQMRAAVFGGGTLQMAVCGAVLAIALAVAGLPLSGAVVAGLSVALSSTAIAVQIMRERGLLAAPLGKSAFAVLLFQDVSAIPLIAVVPLLSGGEHPSVGGVARGVIAVLTVALLGRYLTTPILRVIAKTGLRELFTAFALLLVVGIAAIMETAGLSMGLGAFLAGVLLASSEYRHALETDVEPFRGLLMGLFFIAVGMSIDFGLLRASPLLVLSLVTAVVVLKGLALAAIAPRLEVPRSQRWLFAALVAQGSEFAFVVFGVARTAHLLPGDWDAILTLVVALTMALTPVLLVVHDAFLVRDERRERPADAIESEGAKVIIAGFGRFGQIVGRLLFASGIRATVLDFDPDQIELLKKFGFRVFFGDATRHDLLQAAGAETARLVVVAIDDVEANLRVVDEVRRHYPELPIVARARNVSHYLELRRRGVTAVERETFESALRAGRRALEALGVEPYEAREAADLFRAHNVRSVEALTPESIDESRRYSMARAARAQLEAQFASDRAARERALTGWTAEEDASEREPAR